MLVYSAAATFGVVFHLLGNVVLDFRQIRSQGYTTFFHAHLS